MRASIMRSVPVFWRFAKMFEAWHEPCPAPGYQREAASSPTKAKPACASCREETGAPTALQNAAIGAAAIDSYSAACDGAAFLCTQ
jgi:hypothetical protein